MKEVLGVVENEENTIQEPYPNYGEGDDDETILGQDIVNSCIEKSAQARGRQTNVSFFAFSDFMASIKP